MSALPVSLPLLHNIFYIALSTPTEIEVWIKQFEALYKSSNSPSQIAHLLVQIGIDNPTACHCDGDELKDSILKWIHTNHRQFNKMVWNILITRPEMMLKLRRVLLDDSRTPKYTEEQDRAKFKEQFQQEVPENYEYVPTGSIVIISYAKAMLNGFLWTDKSKVTWI